MKILIKLGGTLLDEASSLTSIARQLAEVSHGYELVIVHGGGKQVTRFLEEQGVTSR
ncbi:MAG: acetylglutamate kinase, partial [Acidobacteriota bacterium]|nr:acetylglutamate kinase [Acidobacteriota bacterium]